MSFIASSPEAIALLLAVLLYGGWPLYRFLRVIYLSPLRQLPGPPASSWVFGNMKEIAAVDDNLLPDSWFEQYGTNYVDHEFFMRPRLWSIDPRAVQHVMAHPNDFPRPEENQKVLRDILGRGLLSVSGDEHRKQRRILNPAFGPAQIRDLTHLFIEKTLELRELWANASAMEGGTARVNVNEDLSRMTLDVIGVAGFGYDFKALTPEGESNEFSIAFKKLFLSPPPISPLAPLLRVLSPVLKLIGNRRAATVHYASQVFRRVGTQLVEEKKAAILREASENQLQGLERKDLQGRDLLTLLIRANMAQDVPDSQRLSDEDVINQIPTFLLAGHGTTSTSSTWALYELSRYPNVQRKLREELYSLQTDVPTMEQLSALSYLDAVVRETLRLHSPVATMFRVAIKDDVIPFSKPFTECYGQVRSEIKVVKGNKIVIPIMAMQRSKDIWGEDALDFRPERWLHPPEAAAAIPGIWGHLLAFSSGPRACIGWRFSIVELKAILFTLLRAFEFEHAVPVEDIVVKTALALRPSLRSEPEQGYQLPLLIKPYKGA